MNTLAIPETELHRELSGVKTRCFRIDWLIPVLGIGVVAGFLVAATSYRAFQRQADVEGAFMPTLDRLSHDHTLRLALKTLHDGRVDEAAQRLDLLLCWEILRADAELASADAPHRWHWCIVSPSAPPYS